MKKRIRKLMFVIWLKLSALKQEMSVISLLAMLKSINTDVKSF
jgi:hypothetical protein